MNNLLKASVACAVLLGLAGCAEIRAGLEAVIEHPLFIPAAVAWITLHPAQAGTVLVVIIALIFFVGRKKSA